LLVVVALVLATNCSSRENSVLPNSGTAFVQPGPAKFLLNPVKPGEEWVLLIAFLKNATGEPLMLRGVRLRGEGLGRVVDVIQLRIAPLPPDSGEYGFVPSGIFKTYPPAILLGGKVTCNSQTLRPIGGYVMGPAREARILVLMRAAKPGEFSVRFHEVTYSQSGREFMQSLPVGMRGTVSEGGHPIGVDKDEQACLSQSRVLPSG
jgi:hypothetical protein